MPARSEIEIEALPEDVWDALVDGERREDWLQEPDREVHIEVVEAPSRLLWGGGGGAGRAGGGGGRGGGAGDACRVRDRRGACRRARDRHRERACGVPAEHARRELRTRRRRLRAYEELRAGGGLSDELGAVFAALADPTRRSMIEALRRDGTTSVPPLSADLPITRQAVAKHLAALDHAGLVERAPAGGREVRYRLRGGALVGASEWIARTEGAWDGRLARLKDSVGAKRWLSD